MCTLYCLLSLYIVNSPHSSCSPLTIFTAGIIYVGYILYMGKKHNVTNRLSNIKTGAVNHRTFHCSLRTEDSRYRKSFTDTFLSLTQRRPQTWRRKIINILNLTIKGYFLRLNIRQKCPLIVWLSVLSAREEFQHLGSVDSSRLLS